MMFREFVPEKLRFWLLLFSAVIFQFSGGIYLSLTHHMVGSLALMQEEVMMAGYASFAGMTLVFPLLFRLKFRFTTKTILLAVPAGLIVCNLITMSTGFLPVLVIVCFIAGALRMWGTFECLSTIQLKITSTRDFAVFFPVVYMIVLGSIQLSGITAGYISYFFRWEYMHLFIIGLLLLIVFCALTVIVPIRLMPKQPLAGIDWISAFLWSLFLMLGIFVLEYGEHYDWFDSSYIRFAAVYALTVLCIILHRAKTIQNPYIDLKAFSHRHVYTILFLFAAMNILLASPTILQNTFTSAVLHYDQLASLSLNWPVLAGIAAGAIFSYVTLVKMQWGYKRMTSIGFALILGYLLFLYFLISPDTNREALYLPLFLRGAGDTILEITLTVYAARTVSFMFFFQVLTIFGLVRTGFGIPLGTSIMGHAMSFSMKQNILSLSSEIDLQNPAVTSMPFDILTDRIQTQALLVSIKEIYGYAAIAGVVILILSLCARYRNLVKLKMPRW
jgi:MFS transporter, DHA2 family, multidrug resistance protein